MSTLSRCFLPYPLPKFDWLGLRRILNLTLLVVGLSLGSAAGQTPTCPEPWASAPNAYGIFILSGTGTAMSGTITQKVSQNATVAAKMAQPILGECAFMAIALEGFGQMKSNANVKDSLSDSSSGSIFTWTASGPGDYSGGQSTFSVDLLSPQYSFGTWDGVTGTYTNDGKPSTEEILWGAQNSNGGASEQNLPLPAGAPLVWGTTSYSSPPFDSAQGGLLDANWNLAWIISPAPDDNCEHCKHPDAPLKGSEISPASQILGENVDLVGTPFVLHYDSSRAPGHAGADLVALLDAHSLGGWTLSAHHVFEPLLQAYCAGGSCTPYAIVPKAVFFGDGNSRNDADVQASVSLNGNYYLTSEDGSEVYVFSPTGLHLQTLTPLTGSVIYTLGYDAQNRLSTVTDANGNVTSVQRNASGNPISITSPFGQKTLLAVDANGFLSKITDPGGHATKLTNSALGLLASLTDPAGHVYSYQYDGLGMLTKHSDPAGGSITLARTNSASGYSVANTTALGRASNYQVAFSSTAAQTVQQTSNTWQDGLKATESRTQSNGQLLESATLPDGTSYSKTIGPDPRWGIQVPITTSESLTRGTLTMNLATSRAATLADPSNPFSLTTQTDTVNINGRAYSFVFTGATKTAVSTTPAGRKTTTVLDAQERISSVQPAGLALSSYTYDSRGRLSSLLQGTRNTTYTYDSNGNLASATNPLGLTTGFAHDAAGNLLTATLADGRVLTYTYDANGNLKSVTPPGRAAHDYSYSAVNLATAYTPPAVAGAGATTYTFNADRDLTKITRPDGEIVTYKYDTAGRLSSVVTPSSTVSYAYNATTGNISKAAVSGGEAIAYGYNGPLPTRSTWTGTVAGYVSRAFNNNFWVTTQGINGANNIAFAYDKDGLVTKAGALTQTHNATNGLYAGSTLASTTDTFTYNTFAEPTSYSAKFGTTALYTANYTRDAIGRIATLKETIGGATTTYSYTYDKAGRLTTVKKDATTVSSYIYDNNSNRLTSTTSSGSATGAYDAQDRLLTYGAASFTYTGNGERASMTSGTQTATYQYDVLGNLIAVTLPSGTAITYIVDAENNRVARKVNGVVAAGFLYDRGNLVAQLDANNQLVSQFVYNDISATPVYMVTGGVTYRIFADHLGSPRLVINSATGQIAERIDYDEFGNITNDTNPGFQPFGFAGGLYDQDTKLVRFGMRDYDAATGRWTAKDPIRFDAGDTNLFGYVQNDPVNLIDPTGLEGDCNCKEKDKIKKMVEDFVDRKNVADQIDYQKQVDAAAKAAEAKAKDAYKTPETIQKPADAPLSAPTVNIRGLDVGIKSVSKTVPVQGGEVKLTGGVSAMVDKAHPWKLPYGITVPGIIPMTTFECELKQNPH